jgi:hypothetical protein
MQREKQHDVVLLGDLRSRDRDLVALAQGSFRSLTDAPEHPSPRPQNDGHAAAPIADHDPEGRNAEALRQARGMTEKRGQHVGARHAHAKPFDPQCLHCLVNFTIEAWAMKNGPRGDDGAVRLDVAYAVSKLAQVMGEMVYHAGDDVTRRHFERFAHAALERAFHAESIGRHVVLSFSLEAAA